MKMKGNKNTSYCIKQETKQERKTSRKKLIKS